MKTNTLIESKNVIRPLLGTAIILLIPLIAMQFSDQVHWTRSDFIAAGIVLFGFGFLYEMVLRHVHSQNQRFIIGVLLAVAFLYLWAELAVGIFTTWGS